MYHWEDENWPNFKFDIDRIQGLTTPFKQLFNQSTQLTDTLTSDKQQDELLGSLLIEVMKSAEIEGEFYSRQDVMSSIKNNLSIHIKPLPVSDKRTNGIVLLLLHIRKFYFEKLSLTKLLNYHSMLFDGQHVKFAGKWRTGVEPMRIISSRIGNETIHYEAPPSKRVPQEMKTFVNWYNTFNEKDVFLNALIKTAITHLYFESIHPFEDGNGRLGRALAEKCLIETLGKPMILSLSVVLEKNKNDYYNALKKAQQSMDLTDWIVYFSEVILEAQASAIETLKFSVIKTNYFDQYDNLFNDRQRKAIARLFLAGKSGFQGGINATTYMRLTNCSKATATRDLHQLKEMGALQSFGAGRSVHYQLSCIYI